MLLSLECHRYLPILLPAMAFWQHRRKVYDLPPHVKEPGSIMYLEIDLETQIVMVALNGFDVVCHAGLFLADG